MYQTCFYYHNSTLYDLPLFMFCEHYLIKMSPHQESESHWLEGNTCLVEIYSLMKTSTQRSLEATTSWSFLPRWRQEAEILIFCGQSHITGCDIIVVGGAYQQIGSTHQSQAGQLIERRNQYNVKHLVGYVIGQHALILFYYLVGLFKCFMCQTPLQETLTCRGGLSHRNKSDTHLVQSPTIPFSTLLWKSLQAKPTKSLRLCHWV